MDGPNCWLIATWAPVGVAGPTAARFQHSKLTDATGVVGTMLSSSSMSMANKHAESDVQIDQKHKSQIYSCNCVLVFLAEVACTFLKIIKIYLTKNDEKHSRLWTRRPSGQPFWSQEALRLNPSGARKLFWATLLEPGSSSLRRLWCQEAAPWHQRVPGGWFLPAITSLLGTLLSAKTLPHGIHTTERKDFPSR